MTKTGGSGIRAGMAAALVALSLIAACHSDTQLGGGSGGGGGSDATGSLATGGASGALGQTGGSGGAAGDASITFACGTTDCPAGTHYCFSEEWNGGVKVAPLCRPLPSGCATCACAESDAEAVSMACASSTAGMVCTDGSATLPADAGSPMLSIACQVP